MSLKEIHAFLDIGRGGPMMKNSKTDQRRMPFVEALEAYGEERFIPFHTPGHKAGAGAPELLKKWMALPYDLGVMYALDDLHEPSGPLKEAQQLAADLYGAEYCWFSINGTTALIECMIMATVGPGDTLIIPREAHRSVMSGLLLSGATPVYLDCHFDTRWGVPLGTTLDDAVQVMDEHPEAKAIVLVYPNYYGIGVDMEGIVREAHNRGITVLVDEAHGPHLPFADSLPVEAIRAGADLVAQSTHKSTGSATQTSMLFGQGPRIDVRRVTQMHQILQSTSPNYLLLASLDMARHQLATEGHGLVGKAVQLALHLRKEAAKIPGIAVMNRDSLDNGGVHYDCIHFDCTKVLIDAEGLGLSAVEFEQLLRRHRIEVELMQAHHVLVFITLGDTEASVEALLNALRYISDSVISAWSGEERIFETSDPCGTEDALLPKPEPVITPRDALYKKRIRIPFGKALNRVSAETISYYPPGIPCLGIGEKITESVIQYIRHRQALGYTPNGADDIRLETIWVLEES